MEVLTIFGGLFAIVLCILIWKKRFLIFGTASLIGVLYLLFKADQIQTIEVPNLCAIGILLTFAILLLTIPPHHEAKQ